MTIKELYPETTNSEAYRQAIEKAVITGHWLFNQSDMDLWYEIDGFTLKVPAGKRSLITGWEDVRRDMETLRDEFYGARSGVYRGGFQFVGSGVLYIYDALVVFSPDGSRSYGYYSHHRTLEECIALINTCKLKKIVIIGDDLRFLSRCPSLTSITIHYPFGAEKGIDYSPLYNMPQICSLNCTAPVDSVQRNTVDPIDYTRINGLREVAVYDNTPKNFHLVPTLEVLFMSGDRTHKDLQSISCSRILKKLDFLQCGIKTLDGVSQFPVQQVNLAYLRSLEDISALSEASPTLRALSIEACGKIKDFSCLNHLTNLEHLHLHGSNTLPNLDFLHNMAKLKTFVFSMTVEDGDLTPCLDIPYAACTKMKRHYNLKESDLPKSKDREAFRLY